MSERRPGMSRSAKSALHSNLRKIAVGLHLSDEFYGGLVEKKIFVWEEIDVIKEEKGSIKQAYKMLKLLEDSGPQALDQFVLLLQENNDWLAKDLQEAYKQKHLEHQEKGRYSPDGHPEDSFCTCRQKHANKSMSESNLTTFQMSEKETGGNLHCASYTDVASTMLSSHKRDASNSPIQVLTSHRKKLSGKSTDRTENTNHYNASHKSTITEARNHQDVHDVKGDYTENVERSKSSRELDKKTVNLTPEDGFPSSKTFYEEARKSVPVLQQQFKSEPHNDEDLENYIYNDENEDDDQLTLSRSTAHFNPNSEQMKNLYCDLQSLIKRYEKQKTVTWQTEDGDVEEELEVTWELIDQTVKKLKIKVQQGDDNIKMIQKCYELFPQNEQQTPLNRCIEKALHDLQEESVKESNERAERAYERRKAEIKMEIKLNQLQDENDRLKHSETELTKLLGEMELKDEENRDNKVTIDKLHKEIQQLQEEIQQLHSTIKKLNKKKTPPSQVPRQGTMTRPTRPARVQTGRQPYGGPFLLNPTINRLQRNKSSPRK